MGRIRRDQTTKVWHNPEISGRRGGHAAAPRVAPTLEERKTQSAHRAALEALFSPKKDKDEEAAKSAKSIDPLTGKPGRIVLAPPPQADPRAGDRQRLLGKLLGAEGRPAITKAANEFFKHGFSLPQEQDVYLQLLEHTSEDRVRDAIGALATILLSELPKRRAVLQSRLRRIEEYAEDSATRTAAAELWRQVTGRGVASSAKGASLPPSSEAAPIETTPAAPDVAHTTESAATEGAELTPETSQDSAEASDAGDPAPSAEVA
ncbi:MAG: hypothetical protein U0441_30365 [Polyangiaceae bacterium]